MIRICLYAFAQPTMSLIFTLFLKDCVDFCGNKSPGLMIITNGGTYISMIIWNLVLLLIDTALLHVPRWRQISKVRS